GDAAPLPASQFWRSLAKDLQNWLAGKVIEARRPKPWERTVKWVRRHRTTTALIASLVLVAGLSFAAELFRRHALRQSRMARQSKFSEQVAKADSALLSGDTHEGLKALAQIV